MAPLRKNITQVTVIAPTAPKGKANTIESPEPADCQTNLSDIHVHDDEDFHSSSAMLWGARAAEPEPQHTSGQLPQMLFNPKKQMEATSQDDSAPRDGWS